MSTISVCMHVHNAEASVSKSTVVALIAYCTAIVSVEEQLEQG
jgi:hypothetical protein